MSAQPSPGAVRAAKAIEADHQFGRMEPQRILDHAAIIDRETAHEDLIHAIKRGLLECDHQEREHRLQGWALSADRCRDAANVMRAALAAAEGSA